LGLGDLDLVAKDVHDRLLGDAEKLVFEREKACHHERLVEMRTLWK